MGGPNFNATVRGNGNPGVQGISPNGYGVEGRSGAAIPAPSAPAGVRGFSDSDPGVDGRSTSGFGVQGTSTSGIAMRGRSIGGNAGVLGTCGSSTGFGVQGANNSGVGVKGNSDSGVGVDGSSTSRVGVRGFSSESTGVFGHSADDNGNGVYGTVGDFGHSGPQGIGVAGDTFNTDGTGVQGRSFSSGNGVYGSSPNGVGVLAHTTSGTAVYGHRKDTYDPINAPNSVAGYFDGGIKVVNGPKAFQIDHPLDPQNKYLVHNAVESSEMKNVYDGVALLDKEGAAWVELPEWFEALNGDFATNSPPL